MFLNHLLLSSNHFSIILCFFSIIILIIISLLITNPYLSKVEPITILTIKFHLSIIKSIDPFNYLKMTHSLKHFLNLPTASKFIIINLISIYPFNLLTNSIIKSILIISKFNLITINSNLIIIIFIF